jgi:hypothetical protein
MARTSEGTGDRPTVKVGCHFWRRNERCEHPDQSHLPPKATSGMLGRSDTNRNLCELAGMVFPWKHHVLR